MDAPQYIKSFSKGQITIPKSIREQLGIANEFWLKIYIKEQKIIAEPMEKEKNKEAYKKKLLSIKGDWLNDAEMKQNRQQVQRQLKRRGI